MTTPEDTNLIRRRIFAAIPAIIAAAAFFTSYLGNFYCDNVQFIPDGEFADADLFRPRPLSFGLFKYRHQRIVGRREGDVQFTESCTGYPSGTEFDFDWRLAQAFSLISVFTAGFLILWQFCAPFLLFDATFWRRAIVLFSFIGICQGMTLKFLVSDACWENPLLPNLIRNPELYEETCSWGWGTRASLASTILYFLTVLSLVIIPAPGTRPSMSDDKAEESESDDESNSGFAFEECDLDSEFAKKKQQQQSWDTRHNTMSKTQSEMYDDNSMHDNSLSDISGLDDSIGRSDTDSLLPSIIADVYEAPSKCDDVVNEAAVDDLVPDIVAGAGSEGVDDEAVAGDKTAGESKGAAVVGKPAMDDMGQTVSGEVSEPLGNDVASEAAKDGQVGAEEGETAARDRSKGGAEDSKAAGEFEGAAVVSETVGEDMGQSVGGEVSEPLEDDVASEAVESGQVSDDEVVGGVGEPEGVAVVGEEQARDDTGQTANSEASSTVPKDGDEEGKLSTNAGKMCSRLEL